MDAAHCPQDKCPDNAFKDIENVGNMIAKSEDIYCVLNDVKIGDDQNVVQSEDMYLDSENSLSVAEHPNLVRDGLTRSKKPSVANPKKVKYKERFIQCEICSKELKAECYKRHLLRHKGIKDHKCEICNKTYVLKNDLNQHMKIHTEIKEHKCHICGKEFSLKLYLKRHMALHIEKEFGCNICGKEFGDKRRLKRHEKCHSGGERHNCHLCSKAFSRKGILTEHLKTVHLEAVEEFRCERCGKTFKLKYNLKSHLRTHIGIKEFKCDICNEEFIHKGSLTFHMARHSTANEFELPLKNDLAANVEGKKFKCEICGKWLTRKFYLRKHMLIHTRKRNEEKFGETIDPEFVFIQEKNVSDVKDEEISPSNVEYPVIKMEKDPLSEENISSEFNEEDCNNIVIKEECFDGL